MQTLPPPPLPLRTGVSGPRAYYRLDLRRLAWLECWRIARTPTKAFLFWLNKLSGQNLAAAGGLPSPRPLAEILLAAHEVPLTVAGSLEALRRESEALGFVEPVYYGHKDSLSNVDAAGCLLRSPDGETIASLAHARGRNSPGQPARCILLSLLADGCRLTTSNGRALFNQPPGQQDIARRVGASVAEIAALHRQRLEAHRARGNPPRPVRTFEELAALHDENERRAYEFNVARGLYVPLTAEEVAGRQHLNDAKQLAAGSAAGPQEAAEAGVLLDRLYRRDHPGVASGAGAFRLLVVSLAVFAVVALLRWSPSLAATIIGVLFFHESGHYLAMRGFGFRNPRMFFIPFLGAAVSGLDPRAPGWQRAVVALAGPLPGLGLAAAVILGQRFLPSAVRLTPGNLLVVKTAILALWINGFNLLPFLPLDGGRVLQETLFCRHPLLRTGFAALAGAGLLALGLNGSSYVLIMLGVLILASLGSTWRIGRTARALQAGGLALSDPGSERTVRPEAIPAILAALKQNREPMPKQAALVNEALAVIDLLRARPPGVTATATLLAAYAVAWTLALGPMWPVISARMRRHVAPTHESVRPVHPPRVHAPATPTPGDDEE